ncbi:hypothetical protein [Methanoregula formicica]|nr:hypothetical protein [Methanoregula formicica]
MVKRKRKNSETSYLRLRQADEYSNTASVRGMNQNLFEIFTFLLEHHQNVSIPIRNFQIKEYDFMPSICMYIFDKKKLVFGPYIAKPCDDIPLITIEGSDDDCWPNTPNNDVVSAYNNIQSHFRILGGTGYPYNKPRKNKQYPRRFSFWDGEFNVPIHTLIKTCSYQLDLQLNSQNLVAFSEFLDVENELFRDQIMDALGKDRDEARFDAVMRHLSDALTIVPAIETSDNIQECIEVVMHLAVRSAIHINANKNRRHNVLRLEQARGRIESYQFWLQTTRHGDGSELLKKFYTSIVEYQDQIASSNLDLTMTPLEIKTLARYVDKMRRSRQEVIHVLDKEFIRKKL